MSYGTLWLPILVSTIVVWLASAVLHMVLKHHNADYKPLANEDAVGEALRKSDAAPGVYFIPHVPDYGQMKDPAVQEKFVKGPVALVTVMRSGPPTMGRNLMLWLGFCALVSFVAAYLARHSLGAAADGMSVMRVTGTIAFVAYGMSAIVDSIWRAIPWSNTLRTMFDGAIYAVLTGLTFWLLR